MSKEFQKTVIILGAGASKDYGFPVGGEIVDKLIEENRNDSKGQVFFIGPEYGPEYEGRSYKSIFKFENTEKLKQYFREKFNLDLFNKQKCFKEDQYYHGWWSLKIFDFYRDFITNLELYRHSQIDYFLRTRKSYANFGKFMIAHEILNQEHEAKIKIENNSFDNDNKKHNWIGEFFAKIIQNAQQPEDLDKIAESLTIVTFNYDLLFEYYLDRFCQGDNEWGEALERFKKKLKIIHIYGKLGRFGWEDPELLNEIYGEEIPKNFVIRNFEQQNQFGFTNNKYCYEKVFELSKGIQVIGGEKHQAILPHIKKAQEAIYDKNCQQIFFFGFGFDENNLIGPLGCELINKQDKFFGKNIYFTIHDEHEEEKILLKVRDFIRGNHTRDEPQFKYVRKISSLLDNVFRESNRKEFHYFTSTLG